jgi:hypothetical protein
MGAIREPHRRSKYREPTDGGHLTLPETSIAQQKALKRLPRSGQKYYKIQRTKISSGRLCLLYMTEKLHPSSYNKWLSNKDLHNDNTKWYPNVDGGKHHDTPHLRKGYRQGVANERGENGFLSNEILYRLSSSGGQP